MNLMCFCRGQGVVPQSAPFMVWRDKVDMEWDEEMREFLQELDDTAEGGTVFGL